MKLIRLNIPDSVMGVEAALIVVFFPIVVVLILMIISLKVVIIPKIDELNQINGQLKTLEDRKKTIIEKRNYLLSIDQAEMKKNMGFINNALFPQKNSYILVEIMRKIADKYGFQVDSFSVKPGDLNKEDEKPVTGKSGVAKLPINLGVIGPVANYLGFINGIENSLPILSLDKLNMKNASEVSRMELSISAYYIEDKTKYEIDNLTLSDLTMDKEEADLLSKLGGFSIMVDSESLESQVDTSKEYVKYDRKDPFSL